MVEGADHRAGDCWMHKRGELRAEQPTGPDRRGRERQLRPPHRSHASDPGQHEDRRRVRALLLSGAPDARGPGECE